MGQTRESGAAARDYGYQMATAVATFLGATLLGSRSNEALWEGQRIVIKYARHRTPEIGVSNAMLERVDSVVVSLESDTGDYMLYRVRPTWYQQEMIPSRSRSPSANSVMMVPCQRVREAGEVIGLMPKNEVKI